MFKMSQYFEYCYLLDKYYSITMEEKDVASILVNTIIDTFPPEMTYRWGKWKAFMEPYRDAAMGLSIVFELQDKDKPKLKVDGMETSRIRIFRSKDNSVMMTGKDPRFGYEVEATFDQENIGGLVKLMLPGSAVTRKKATPDTDLKYVKDNFPVEMQNKICGAIMTYRLKKAVENNEPDSKN